MIVLCVAYMSLFAERDVKTDCPRANLLYLIASVLIYMSLFVEHVLPSRDCPRHNLAQFAVRDCCT